MTIPPRNEVTEMTSPPDPSRGRLRMEGIEKRFGATHALRGVNLSVDPGETLALVGENGAGKSTLMKILSGAHRPDAGTMWLDGQPYRPRSPLDARQAGIAMIYQELSLAPHLSVLENILLGVEPTLGPWWLGPLFDWRAATARASDALRQVGLATLPPRTPIAQLSVAQQQLVEIARAVALRCRVLVLDEPTSSLTQHDIEILFRLIGDLKRAGISIIYISHFLEEVQQISDRLVVLRDGESVGERVTASAEPSDMIAMMVGRNVDELYPRSPREAADDVVLSVRGLSGQRFRDVDLNLHRGRVTGIAGLVGAGRTELLRAIFGLDRVRSGDVQIGSNDRGATPQRRWRQGVGFVSEDRKREGLAQNLSLADNITLSHLEGLGPGPIVDPRRQRAATRQWIERLGIKCETAQQPVEALSGGNQQKVALARLLHADVDILLLDEPTRGIDVGSKAQIYQLIDRLASGDRDQGIAPKAILMVSSYLPELLGVCDDIAVMSRGRLSETRPVDEWNEHSLMIAATGQL